MMATRLSLRLGSKIAGVAFELGSVVTKERERLRTSLRGQSLLSCMLYVHVLVYKVP
jgi:hypothetical protein